MPRTGVREAQVRRADGSVASDLRTSPVRALEIALGGGISSTHLSGPSDSLIVQLELVSTPNAAYAAPFRVLVASVCRHLNPRSQVRWHVVAPDLEASERVKLEESVASHPVRFAWYDERADREVRLPVRGRAVAHMYERLFVAERLPAEVDRFLYLDVDTLVLRDLAPLWNTQLQGAVLAAVQDIAVPLV